MTKNTHSFHGHPISRQLAAALKREEISVITDLTGDNRHQIEWIAKGRTYGFGPKLRDELFSILIKEAIIPADYLPDPRPPIEWLASPISDLLASKLRHHTDLTAESALAFYNRAQSEKISGLGHKGLKDLEDQLIAVGLLQLQPKPPKPPRKFTVRLTAAEIERLLPLLDEDRRAQVASAIQ